MKHVLTVMLIWWSHKLFEQSKYHILLLLHSLFCCLLHMQVTLHLHIDSLYAVNVHLLCMVNRRDFALQHMCEYGICARKTGHGLFSHSHLRIFYLDPNHQYLHWHPPPLQSSTTEGVAAAVPEFSIGDGTTSYVAVTSILRVERGSPNQHDKKYLTVLVDYDTANSSASSSVSTSQVRTEKTRHSSMILTGGIAGVADSKSLTLSMNTDSDVTMFMDCLLYLRKRKNAVAS